MMELVECDGLCVYGADIGVPSAGVAYAHPGCPLHDPDDVCECGNPDRCSSPTHGQITMAEALQIRHAQRRES
ncbi:MAG TPA: hypothetical protein VIP77_16070 [Jiangellaceae bacterium]